MRIQPRLSILPAGLVAVALAASPNANAQSTGSRVSVQPAASASGLDDFKGHRPAEATDWRAANARVAAVGGWRAYAREQQQARSTEPKPSQPATAGVAATAKAASAPNGHMGHKP